MKTLVKALISAGLIAFVFLYKVEDPGRVLDAFADLHPGWLAASFCLHFLGLGFSARRWQLLLLVQRMKVPMKRLLTLYLVGAFFNTILPGRTGGDVYRIWESRHYGDSNVRPLVVVLVERGVGLLTLLLIALAVLLLGWVDFPERWPIAAAIIGALSVGLLGVALLFHPRLSELGSRAVGRTRVAKVKLLIREGLGAVREYSRHPRLFGGALLFNVLLQFNYILHYYFLSRAMDLPPGFAFYCVAVPVVAVMLMIPVTIIGVGLREYGWISFFALAGVNAAQATAFSLCVFSMLVVFGLVGGVLYALRR